MQFTAKRNLIVVLIVFLAGILAGGRVINEERKEKETGLYSVQRVIDGDTFRLQDNQRVRIIGIDSPEKGGCYYNEARVALKNLIEGKNVRLDKDISEKYHYGRLLRHAVLVSAEANIIVGRYMVENGFARAVNSPPDNRYHFLLASAQNKAKRENKGLWQACPQDNKVNNLRERDTGPDNPNCIIKGNISEKGYGKTYLIPGCDNYNLVKIDQRKGEKYFCTEKEAQAAGFRKATNCP